jgi:hypothetical protein
MQRYDFFRHALMRAPDYLSTPGITEKVNVLGSLDTDKLFRWAQPQYVKESTVHCGLDIQTR